LPDPLLSKAKEKGRYDLQIVGFVNLKETKKPGKTDICGILINNLPNVWYTPVSAV